MRCACHSKQPRPLLPPPQVCTVDLDSARTANATAQEALAACAASKGPLAEQLSTCQGSLKAASDSEAAARSQLATCIADSQAAAAACTSEKAALGAACAADKKAAADACAASLAGVDKTCMDAKVALGAACDADKGALQVLGPGRERLLWVALVASACSCVCRHRSCCACCMHSTPLHRLPAPPSLQTSLDSCNTRRAALRTELSTCVSAKDACLTAKTAAENDLDVCNTDKNYYQTAFQGACAHYDPQGSQACACNCPPYSYCA